MEPSVEGAQQSRLTAECIVFGFRPVKLFALENQIKMNLINEMNNLIGGILDLCKTLQLQWNFR
jgi:hypothetical protein